MKAGRSLALRKKLFFLLLCVITNYTLLISNSCSQWVQIGPPGRLNVTTLVASGNNIFAGTEPSEYSDRYGVYLSTDNGNTWTQTSLNNHNIRSFAISGNNILAGSDTNVYLSTNNGSTWAQNSLNNLGAMCLAISGNNIFAGTYDRSKLENGVYLSTNNGRSWTLTSLHHSANSIVISGDYIFAGTSNDYGKDYGNGVYLSTNNGETWRQAGLNGLLVSSLVISGNNIFAGTDCCDGSCVDSAGAAFGGSNVYLSTNNGRSWTSIADGCVIALAATGSNIFVSYGHEGGDAYFSLSTNNGSTWTQTNGDVGYGNIYILSFLITGTYIYAGTTNSIYRRPLSELTGIK